MNAASCKNSYCPRTLWGAAVPGVSSHDPHWGGSPLSEQAEGTKHPQVPGKGCTEGPRSWGSVGTRGSLRTSRVAPGCPRPCAERSMGCRARGCWARGCHSPPQSPILARILPSPSRNGEQQRWRCPHSGAARREGVSWAAGGMRVIVMTVT